ncbi:Endoplasmic reticulum membrane-associated oxidoreductin involved in disulfide bond formation, partial [Trachipleistophora hominis]
VNLYELFTLIYCVFKNKLKDKQNMHSLWLFISIVLAVDNNHIKKLLEKLCNTTRFSSIEINLDEPCAYTGFDTTPHDTIPAPVSLLANPHVNTNYLEGSAIWKKIYEVRRDTTHTRLVNGMHFSTFVFICKNYYDQGNGTYLPNKKLFHEKYSQEKYEDFLLLRESMLKTVGFCNTNSLGLHREERKLLEEIKKSLEHSSLVKMDEKRIQDMQKCVNLISCVSCARCKLWGKLKFVGLMCAIKLQNRWTKIDFDEFVCFVNFTNHLVIAYDAVENVLK